MNERLYENYYWQDDLIRLRPWSEDDWEWIYNYGFDTEGGRLAGLKVELPPTVQGAKEYSSKVANLEDNNGGTIFVIETLNGVHVGRIGIGIDDYKNGTFGIGLRISSEHRGKGYGKHAMKMLLKYAFMEKRLNKCSGTVLEGNEGSIKMHKGMGFEQEGVFRQSIYTNGRYYDEIIFGLTKDDYLKIYGN